MLVLVVMITSSCEDFLNTKPSMKIGSEQYYTDEAGITSGLYGVYDVLQSGNLYSVAIFKTFNVSTDEGYLNDSSVSSGIRVNSYDATDSSVAGFWQDLYRGIERANDIIANINIPNMDETARKQVLGEALFLRGYFYFMLVSHFGDVPLRLTPTTTPVGTQMARTPSTEVYAQILKDMKDAEGMVRPTKWEHTSRVSKTVVQGFLARVCLQMAGYPLMDTSKYAEALTYSQKVIDSGERGLNVTYLTDPKFTDFYTTTPPAVAPAPTANNAYRQIFINMSLETYDTRESMWEVEFKGNLTDGYREDGQVGLQIGIANAPSNTTLLNQYGYCYGYVKGTARLYNSYGVGDLRRDCALSTFTYSNNNTTGVATKNPIITGNPFGRYCAKWRREYEVNTPKSTFGTAINFPILRYADVLLMNAEAQNQVNGPTAAAYEAVNQVRRRGYGLPIGTASLVADLPAGLDKAGFQQKIQDERMRELCFEGTRRNDLIRWGLYVPTMNAVGAELTSDSRNPDRSFSGRAGNNTSTRHLLLPIPSIEMLSNPLIKSNNTGW